MTIFLKWQTLFCSFWFCIKIFILKFSLTNQSHYSSMRNQLFFSYLIIFCFGWNCFLDFSLDAMKVNYRIEWLNCRERTKYINNCDRFDLLSVWNKSKMDHFKSYMLGKRLIYFKDFGADMCWITYIYIQFDLKVHSIFYQIIICGVDL